MTNLESQLKLGPRFTYDRRGDARFGFADVDKTLLPNESAALPSERVVGALSRASEVLPKGFGLATARQPQKAMYLIEHMNLTGHSILSNGAQIVDGETGLMVINRILPLRTTMIIARELQAQNIDHWIQDNGYDHRWTMRSATPRRDRQASQGLGTYSRPVDILDKSQGEIDVQGYTPNIPYIIVANEVSAEKVIEIQQMVSGYDNQGFTAFVAHEQSLADGNKTFQVFITHKNTNKRDAMSTVAELKEESLEDAFAVGDGPNDTVLVANVGIGVAMGNAVEQTIAAAVYIAPEQKDDGAAIAIEELILDPKKAA